MIDRVERLGRVKKEEETVKLKPDRLEKEGIYVDRVIASIFPDQKTFLDRRNVSINSRHNAPGDRRGQEPVVSVSDAKGTGVGKEASLFLGEEEKDPVVKALGGEMAPEDGP